ncbi:type II toxin-antitoxin system PemK/MazF family toxin [Georgenia sp. Z1344]|uniref:type II toxin-antitoxin system PemK/MazF family toxin n=1 Tax=Georgenia sp. Z1344 TaxID=3416706 RepID=UPI003CFAC174
MRRPSLCATIPTTWPSRARSPPTWTRSVRGDIYRLRAPKDSRGHEQGGARLAVVVQSDDLPLSTWLVAPTSTGRRPASFRPEVRVLGSTTRVMLEQMTVVDPEVRLGEFVGRLDTAELHAVDEALLLVLGLD